MLKRLSEVARQNGIQVFICGEMAGYPIHTPLLLGLGLDELSMNPQSIPTIKQMIRSINVGETEALVDEALKLMSAEKVFALLRDTYGNILRIPRRNNPTAQPLFQKRRNYRAGPTR